MFKNTVECLYISSNQLKSKIKNSRVIASKKHKILRNKVNKRHTTYVHWNYKTLLRENREYFNKWRDVYNVHERLEGSMCC